MKIKEIPLALFMEFSKLSSAEAQRIKKDGKSNYEVLIRPLNISKMYPGAIGIGGCISLNRSFRDDVLWETEPKEFILWDKIPEGKIDVFEPRPILSLLVAHWDDCQWCHGCGREYMYDKRLDLHIRLENGLSVFNPLSDIVARIIQHARELAIQCEEYWEHDPRYET